LLIQTTLGILQYFFVPVSNFFKVMEYLKDGEMVRQLDPNFKDQKIVTGTLWAMANYGVVVSSLLLYFFNQLVFDKVKGNKIGVSILVGLAAVTVLLTGIRSAAISLIFGLMMIIWFKDKKVFFITILMSLVTFFLYAEILSKFAFLAAERAVSIESPLQRLAGLFLFFTDNPSPKGLLTFQRTMDLVMNIDSVPWFGIGERLVFGEYDSYTDAFLVILILDFGIIGFTLLLTPYVYILRLVRKYCPYHKVVLCQTLFLVLILQTIVDQGLFYNVNNAIFIIICGYLIKKYKGTELKQLKFILK
jgi:hypothetical protein